MSTKKKASTWSLPSVVELVLAALVTGAVAFAVSPAVAMFAGLALAVFLGLRSTLRGAGFVAALLAVLLLASQAQAAATAVGVTKVVRSGVTLTAQAIDYAGGNYVPLTGGEFIVVITSAMDLTMTVTDQQTNLNGYTNDAVCFTPAGKTKIFGPWNPNRWGDGNKRCQFTWTASGSTTGATVMGGKLPYGESEATTK